MSTKTKRAPQFRRCSDCEWFDRKLFGLSQGLCRYGAPVTPTVHGMEPWPAVHDDDWCGGFRPARGTFPEETMP